MTQKEAVLAHMKKGKSITPLDALRLFGCFRLAAVIYKLREDGHVINMVMVPQADGNPFARYRLVK